MKVNLYSRVCSLKQVHPVWGLDNSSADYEICSFCDVEFGYEDIACDAMGNITTLNRNGTGLQNYTYLGNRLSSVSGGISRSYTYDNNGNALTDGTHTFTYNLLNLPATVTGGNTTSYTYDASGRKLKQLNGAAVTNYIDGIHYAGTTIDFIQTEEGLARRSGTNYLYEYALTNI